MWKTLFFYSLIVTNVLCTLCNSVQPAKCAYSVLIIAVYWMTECLPMAVTSILPVVLMTWLGVMDSRELCRSYLKVIFAIIICDSSELLAHIFTR